jgi:hypothetical protein
MLEFLQVLRSGRYHTSIYLVLFFLFQFLNFLVTIGCYLFKKLVLSYLEFRCQSFEVLLARTKTPLSLVRRGGCATPKTPDEGPKISFFQVSRVGISVLFPWCD